MKSLRSMRAHHGVLSQVGCCARSNAGFVRRAKVQRFSSGAEPLRRPGVQAAWHRLLVAPALWRDVKSDNAGIADQRRKIPRLEEKFWLGVHGIERVFRQRVAQFVEAAGERSERRRTEDRQSDVGDMFCPA